MYRVMIADDEGIVIDSLKVIIEKNFGKSCVVESAKSGRAVIELAETFRPDIAFMDIQMPGINGIDAIEEIKKTNPSTQFIILSAYDKFDYAKKALKLGVVEYLMKPFNREKIVTCMELTMKHVDEERDRRIADLRNRERLETVIPILESGFIYNILFDETNDETDDIDQFKELLGVEEEYAYMVMIEYGDELEEGNLTNPVGVSVKAQGFYRDLREIAKEFFPCIVGPAMANRVLLLVPCSQPETEYNERIRNIERARDMLRKLRRRIDVQFRIGIGSVQSFGAIRISYREAQKAMKSTRRSVAHIRDLTVGMDSGFKPLEIEKRLLLLVHNGNTLGAQDEARLLMELLLTDYGESTSQIKGKVLDLTFQAQREVKGEREYAENLPEHMECYDEINQIKGAQELKQWFLEKISVLCSSRKDEMGDHSQGVVSDAKRYIEQNFHRDISLEEVSRNVNISPYYFSKVFKEETQMNFIEYVTGMRIEKAKLLLSDGQMNIKEVCRETGYGDPNYFSRIFKKMVGVTPTEYREKMLG